MPFTDGQVFAPAKEGLAPGEERPLRVKAQAREHLFAVYEQAVIEQSRRLEDALSTAHAHGEELASINEMLSREVTERERAERALVKAQEELVHKTRLATIGQVSATIAHELRNPLGSIANAAFYLKAVMGRDNPKCQKHLGIIREEVIAADRIIGDLLEMTRGKEPRKGELDLAVVLDAA